MASRPSRASAIKAENQVLRLFSHHFVFELGRRQAGGTQVRGHLADIGQPAVRRLLAAQLVHKAQLHALHGR